MALIVGSAAVASGMSPLVEGALYADDVFIDGQTFTSKFDVNDVGQIQVVKYANRGIKDPGVPGQDFTPEEYANSVVDINCVNCYQADKKVPLFYESTMPVDVQASKVVQATMDTLQDREAGGLACLLQEGTASSVTTAITKSNIKDIVLAERATLRTKHARPNVVLASIAVYNVMLAVAGTDYIPMYNDEVVREGRIGRWMGMLWVETPWLSQDFTLKYKDGASTHSKDTDLVDFIMYDYLALSIIDKLALARIIDSEKFAGSLVQVEVDTGFKVTNSDCVIVKSHAA